MVLATQDMLARWTSLVDKGPFDVAQEMSRLTLAIGRPHPVWRRPHGQRGDRPRAPGGPAALHRRPALVAVAPAPQGPHLAAIRARRAVRALDAVVYRIIADRRRRAEGGDDLLGMLLAAQDERTGERMSDVQLRDEVMTLMLAGHETTANALSWTWFLLSRCPSAARALYAELDAVLAGRRGLGVGPETVVGLCVERSPEMVVGLLGILKAGGAYLPLDPSYPAERLSFMLGDARAAVLVTQAALVGRLPTPAAAGGGSIAGTATAATAVVRLDADWAEVARRPTHQPAVATDPEHPAYVIYTSGSTGTPKGVVVTQANLANKMSALENEFGVNENFRSAVFISCSFDASVEQTLLPFMGGGAVVLISDETRETPSAFWKHVERDAVTFISSVPSYLDTMLHQISGRPSLDHLALGGEAFTEQLRSKITRQLEVARITNLYGPTETTIDAIAHRIANREMVHTSRSGGQWPIIGSTCWTTVLSPFAPV